MVSETFLPYNKRNEVTKMSRQRLLFTVKQKLDYAKLMVNEGHLNQQIIEISGASSTAIKT